MHLIGRFSALSHELIVALTALGACIAWIFWLGTPDFPLDDAYIVQHSVEGLRAGAEHRYIGSTPLDGATSRLHVFLLTALSFVMPVAWAQVLVTVVAVTLYLVGVFRLARQSELGPVSSAEIVLLAVIGSNVMHHLLNGLESSLAMAGLVWSFIAFQQARPVQRWPYVLLAMLPFIRVELGLWSALLMARALLDISGPDRLAEYRGFLIRSGLAMAAVVLPMVAIILALGGELLPNTISAKEAFFAESCMPDGMRLRFLLTVLMDSSPMMGVMALGLIGVIWSRLRWLVLIFVVVFLAVFEIKLPGGLLHNFARYLHMLFPFFILGLIEMLRPGSWLAGRKSYIVLGVAVVGSLFLLPAGWQGYETGIEKSRTSLRPTAEWTATNLPANAVILIHDAGMVSLYGEQRLVDLVGLKTPSSVPIHQATTQTTCSRDPRAMDQIASKSNATHFVVLNEWDEVFEMSDGLRRSGWTLTRADSERGETRYFVYALTPPDPV